MTKSFDPTIRIVVTGVGGHGVVSAARWIAEAALSCDLYAVMSEIHGMSQRGGIVESSVVISKPGEGAQRSPMVGIQSADLLIATEPLEALRAANRFLAPHGVVVTYTVPNPPVTFGGPKYPPVPEIIRHLASIAQQVWTIDPPTQGKPLTEAGHPFRPNAALLGATMRSGALPLSLDDLLQVLPRIVSKRHIESNIASLKYGFEKAQMVRL